MPHPDLKIAECYQRKAQHAKSKGVKFTISFASYKNMYNAKKCFYTGLSITAATMTVDRINCNQGYEPGNVVCCHKSFNTFKGAIENPNNPFNRDIMLKAMKKWVLAESRK